jgi:hypothetical protein
MARRKIQWVAKDRDGDVVGVFPSKKLAYTFHEEDKVTLTKMVWNGFYHSEKPLEYDPYASGTVSLYEPMF